VGAVTGDEVRVLRSWLDLTVPQFADLVGTSQATVYRWEQAGPKLVAVEPGHLRLLSVMRLQAQSERRDEVAASVRSGLIERGGLFGLYRLLGAVCGQVTPRGGAARA
jgi:hypothetical protein